MNSVFNYCYCICFGILCRFDNKERAIPSLGCKVFVLSPLKEGSVPEGGV